MDGFDGLLENIVQLRSPFNLGSEKIPATGCLGNTGIVWDRVKRDVDLLVRGLGAGSLRMDKKQRLAWGVPSCTMVREKGRVAERETWTYLCCSRQLSEQEFCTFSRSSTHSQAH